MFDIFNRPVEPVPFDPYDDRIKIMCIPEVRRILFNDPATIVFWKDGTKTVVRVTEGDRYVPYYGFLAALAKKVYGSNTRVQEMIRLWLPSAEEKKCGGDCIRCEKCGEKKEPVEPAKKKKTDPIEDLLNDLFALAMLTSIKEQLNEKTCKHPAD